MFFKQQANCLENKNFELYQFLAFVFECIYCVYNGRDLICG